MHAEKSSRVRKAPVLVWIEERYRTALRDPTRLLAFSVAGIAIIVLGGVLLFVFAPEESPWTVFDHVAALSGAVGLLLALPALGYAAHTDTVAKYIFANLTKQRDLPARPPDQKELTLAEPTARFDTDDMQPGDDNPPMRIVETLELEPSLAPLAIWLAPEPPDSPIGASQVKNALSRFALETAIQASDQRGHIRDLLAKSQVFALGEPATEDSTDFLHFEIEENGRDVVLMPVFTNWRIFRDALLRNPEWQTLSVLVVNGGEIIDNRDSDVALVVNPWATESEFQLPPPVG